MPLINVGGDNVGPKATPKQLQWLPVYFADAGFNLAQSKDYLEKRYGVRNADELTIRQASIVIDDLKCRKKQIPMDLKGENESDF